ncbi:hypothetical protein ACF09C_23655 [Streptomyces sp. NPDC014870]|uniref:hypothetical protein n=1 Tax=Streptomyces sp. NPDC014870 TaxID=3364925 RepID=UPI0036FFED99
MKVLTVTTDRTPGDLAAELANMRAVDDWPSVWSGPPQSGSGEFDRWCGRYGWEPLTFDRQLQVRTTGGGRWTFYDRVGGQWAPLVSLNHFAWQMSADTAADNPAVFGTVDQTWPAYLKAAEGVLGAPTWTGPWDAADFPEPPHPGYWNDREERVFNHEPYRFAYWAPVGDTPGLPYIVLDQTVTFGTWTSDTPGGSAISLEVHRPAEFLETGP